MDPRTCGVLTRMLLLPGESGSAETSERASDICMSLEMSAQLACLSFSLAKKPTDHHSAICRTVDPVLKTYGQNIVPTMQIGAIRFAEINHETEPEWLKLARTFTGYLCV